QFFVRNDRLVAGCNRAVLARVDRSDVCAHGAGPRDPSGNAIAHAAVASTGLNAANSRIHSEPAGGSAIRERRGTAGSRAKSSAGEFDGAQSDQSNGSKLAAGPLAGIDGQSTLQRNAEALGLARRSPRSCGGADLAQFGVSAP